MSQPHKPQSADDLLHRYHDGELELAERARVEASLDETSREKLAALDELGGALRGLYQGQAAEFDAWPAVERGIASAKVVPFTRRLRSRSAMWISSVAAAAAVLAVVVLPRGGQPSNDCDVDELEVSGAVATILKLDDDNHGGSTTVVWIEE